MRNLIFSRTAIDTYFVLTGNLFTIIFSFLFTVLTVRLLSLADFGIFSVLLTLLLLIAEIADMGIGNSLSYFLPKLKNNLIKRLSFVKAAFLLQLIIIVFLVSIIILTSPFLAQIVFHQQDVVYLITIVALLGIPFSSWLNFFQYCLSAIEKFIKVAVVSASSSFLRLIFLLILIVFSKISLASIVWIQVLSFILASFFAFSLVGFDFLANKLSFNNLRKIFFFASFLGTARTLTAVASKLDLVMLIALSDAYETGLYATAVKVISVYPLVAGSLTTVIAPKISAIAQPAQLYSFIKKVTLVTLGLIGTIIVFMIIAQPFMMIVFGPKVALAVPMLRLLLLAMIFLVSSIPAVGVAVYYLHKPFILTINSFLQLIIVIVGNLLFIPYWGGIGAALSLNLAYGITLLLTLYLTFYYLKKENRQS